MGTSSGYEVALKLTSDLMRGDNENGDLLKNKDWPLLLRCWLEALDKLLFEISSCQKIFFEFSWLSIYRPQSSYGCFHVDKNIILL